MRVAIDTNRLTDLFRGDGALAEQLGGCANVYIPLPVIAELTAGFLGGLRMHENEAILHRFLAKSSVQVLLPTRTTADMYAGLFVQLRSAGTPIPVNDIWIASLALEHGLTLITRDRHFQRIPQLMQASG